MNTEVFETDVRDKILAAFSAHLDHVDVEVVPEVEDDFRKPREKAIVWVGYEDSKYKDSVSAMAVSQPEDVCFVLTLQAALLKGDYGIYWLKRHLDLAVIGWKPPHCDMEVHAEYFGRPRDGRPSLIDGYWTFEYFLKTRTVLVQGSEPDNYVIPASPGLQSVSSLADVTNSGPYNTN